MHAPAEFLDSIRARHQLPSDYACAQLLGVSRQVVSRWRNGHGGMSDDHAARVAQLLELDVGHVLARLYAERATSDAARSVWLDLARRLGPPIAACLVLLLCAPLLGLDGSAAWGGLLCIMSNGLVAFGVAAAVVALTRSGDAQMPQRPARRWCGAA